MESKEKSEKKSYDNAKTSENDSNMEGCYTHSERNFVNLIAQILVNISMKEYHDQKKSN